MYKTGDHQGLIDDVAGILGLMTIGVTLDVLTIMLLTEIVHGKPMLD